MFLKDLSSLPCGLGAVSSGFVRSFLCVINVVAFRSADRAALLSLVEPVCLGAWSAVYRFYSPRADCRNIDYCSETVGTHKGHVSFPGGHRDDGESAADAAVRETVEELGVHASSISVLGYYHDVIASTD